MRDLMWISSRLLHFHMLFNSIVLLFVCSCFFSCDFASEKFIEPFTYKICFSFNETHLIHRWDLWNVNDVFYHSMKNKIIFSPASLLDLCYCVDVHNFVLYYELIWSQLTYFEYDVNCLLFERWSFSWIYR